jgi:hypothetical protein
VSLSRRDFLAAAAASTVAGTLSATPVNRKPAKSCIFLHLVGGPSHLDTFDPKPDAPSDIRGPFGVIPTAVPGVHLSELLPKTAALMKDISLIRSLHHTEAPIHENGFQLLHTGRRYGGGKPWPGMGAVIHHLLGDGPFNHTEMDDFPSWWNFAHTSIETGIDIDRGLSRAYLPSRGYDVPLQPYSRQKDTPYPFWVSVEGAVTAVRSGARFVNLFMYETVFDKVSWDCHADHGRLATDLNDYHETVCPAFDHTFDKLIGQLKDRGLLDQTLIVATGEFGRTPKLNANGGRDHWPGCWTALIAGGGVQGGRVIGSSDAIGAEPKDRPVTCPELVATIYHAMGIPCTTTIPDPTGKPARIVDAEPVLELF